ncbi:hypothetical protein P7K49_017457 [Saguinus oedipus]|uniref:Uncharacterized protein n=1 Tax=Saguinus oedipus TaxID=9490 RepID=A0ABQ9V2L2_SAGOE|nr:hypothetical protein P7K49_017457 [Saguinus oedipus]
MHCVFAAPSVSGLADAVRVPEAKGRSEAGRARASSRPPTGRGWAGTAQLGLQRVLGAGGDPGDFGWSEAGRAQASSRPPG